MSREERSKTMKLRSTLVLLFIAARLAAAPVGASISTAFIDFGSQVRTIRGFGGADAWMPQMGSAEANALFSNGNNQQMRMSILRMRIKDWPSLNFSNGSFTYTLPGHSTTTFVH